MSCCAEKTSQPSVESIKLPPELVAYIAEWKDKPGRLIPILHKVQSVFGYIPEAIASKVAVELDENLAQIYGVISFYHLFKLQKTGIYKISVCMGTACYLRGAQTLVSELESLLGISVNSVTEDGLFSLEIVRCVGCCGLAPVMTINDEVYGGLSKDDLPAIIAKYTNQPAIKDTHAKI